MKLNLNIFRSLHEESNEGWIWTSPVSGINSRDLVNVINKSTGKSICVYCRIIDNNYVNIYNSNGGRKNISNYNSIVLSSYYRDKLGIMHDETNSEFELKKIKFYQMIKIIRFLFGHPEVSLKLVTILAVTSIFFGFIGIIISIIGICKQ